MATPHAGYTSDDDDLRPHHPVHSPVRTQAAHPAAYDSDSGSDDVVHAVQHVQLKQGVSARRASRDSHQSRHSQHSQQQAPASPVSSRGGRGGYSFEDHHGVDLHSPVLTHSPAPALASIPAKASDSRNSWEENDSEDEPYHAAAYDYGHDDDEDEDEDDYEERPRSHLQQTQLPHVHAAETPAPNARHAAKDSDVSDREDDYADDYSFDYKRQSHLSARDHPQTTEHQDSHQHQHQHSYKDEDEDEDEDRDYPPRPHHHHHEQDEEKKHSFDSDDRSSVHEADHHIQNQRQSHRSSHPSSHPSSHRSSHRVSYRQEEHDHGHHSDTDDEPENFYENFGDEPHSSANLAAPNHNRASVQSANSHSSHTKHHSFGYDETPAAHAEDPSDSESASSESEVEKAFVDVPTSPPPPPIPSKSRPTSTLSLNGQGPASPTLSRGPASPTLSRGPPSPTFSRGMGSPVLQREETPVAAQAPSAPVSPAPAPVQAMRSVKPEASLIVDTVSQKSGSSLSSTEHRQKRYSGSDSDTSGTSIDLHSPTPASHSNSKSTNVFTRTLSSTSTTREKSHRPTSAERQRPISYATVFSDAELNDISLMDEPLTEKRASVVVPRTPVTPSSGFGFSSNFFGGGRSQPAGQQPQLAPAPSTPLPVAQSPSPASTTPTAPSPALSPAPNAVRSARSGSISALASSIQGAFSRGFSSQSAPPVPPLPKTPSQIGQRNSNAPSMDPRFSTNSNLRGQNSDRASTISNMTNDSNMDLLLARLEAQNEILEQESKRRFTNESDMDRAIGHAKEESAGENIDWDYWGALMHDYNAVVKKNPKQLTAMIQRGVPSALRGLIWQLLAKSKDPALEATYAELLKGSSSHEKQITRDLSRTFPNHEYFQAEGLGQEALFNVVKAYSLYDPEVGYCQGLSFVVGPLLLNMPDEEAFCVLVRMMTTYEMRGHYTPEMNVLQLRLYQFEQLMEESVPLVFKHLRNQGIRSTMYASQWFMTLFAYKFPLELVYRVYDIILVEGVESLLRFSIALLKANHDKILSLDFEVLIEFLKNGLFEPYVNDHGMFIQDAYNVKVTPKKLGQYAQKYHAMVQKQQAELAAEESLQETNKQLSFQVRQLEGSLHTLNKEHVDLAKELITRKMDMAQLQDDNDVLTQKVGDLTRIVDSQGKEVEEQYKNEIQDVLRKNMEYLKRNEQLEDQMAYLENLVIETKMKYAESENERDALTRKLSDMRKALGVA